MKKSTLILLSLLGTFLSSCQDHNLEPDTEVPPLEAAAWRVGGQNNDQVNSVALDAQGNWYLLGDYDGSFIAKYSGNGVLVWMQKLKGTGNSIAVDNQGNVYVSGALGVPADYGNTPTDQLEKVYLVKYNTEGVLQWTRTHISARPPSFPTSFVYIVTVTVDEIGDVYATGGFHDVYTFGETTLSSIFPEVKIGGQGDIFVVKLNRDGDYQWVKKFGGSQTDLSNGITTDKAGNLYIFGYSTSTDANFGAGPNNRGGSAFVAKYTPAGILLWATRPANTSLGQDHLAVDGSGNCYLLTVQNLSKISSNGVVEWLKSIPSGTFTDITANASGDFFLTGGFSGSLLVDEWPLTSMGEADVVLARYTSDGRLLSLRRDGDIHRETANRIVVGPAGSLYVTGTCNLFTTLAGTNLTSAGGTDIFIARYQQ